MDDQYLIHVKNIKNDINRKTVLSFSHLGMFIQKTVNHWYIKTSQYGSIIWTRKESDYQDLESLLEDMFGVIENIKNTQKLCLK